VTKRIVVGLKRHRMSELPSESVATLFGAVDDILGRHFELRRLPAYVRALAPDEKRRATVELLHESDVFITDLDPEVLAWRNEEKPSLPVVSFGLGAITKGRPGVRSTFSHFTERDVVLLNCRADMESFRDFASSCRASVRLVPLGVDTKTFVPPTETQRRAMRLRLGFRESDVVFLYAGRIASDKNLHSILTVLAPLMARDERVRLLIAGRPAEELSPSFWVGPNDIREIIRQVFRGLPILGERTTMLPALAHRELCDVHHAADAFICLTLAPGENFGYAQVEAMSSGLPVIATDWCGLKDAVVHGETGYRVDTLLTERGVRLDAWQAYRYCEILAHQPEIGRRMGQNGRRRAESLYSLGAFEQGLLATITACLQVPADVPRGENRLTPFGERLTEAFRAEGPRLPGEPASSPRWASFSKRKHYPLYETLIRRSCTGKVRLAFGGAQRLWIAPLSWEIRGDMLEIMDPIHPGSSRATPDQRAVLRALNQASRDADFPFATYGQLEGLVPKRMSLKCLRRALRSLVARGVVMISHESEQETCR